MSATNKSSKKEDTSKEDSRNPSIGVSIDFSEKYNRYANPQRKKDEDKVDVYFQRMVDLFMLSMVHGYKTLKKVKPIKTKEEIFKWSNLKETDILLIKAISLIEKNKEEGDDPSIIYSKSEMIEIAEGYANAGFSDLISKLVGSIDFEKNLLEVLTDELEE